MLINKIILPYLLFALFCFNYNFDIQKVDTSNDLVQSTSSIEISLKKENEKGVISFKITNTGEKVFYTGPICSSNNKIILIPEEGNQIERSCVKKIIPIEIQPRELLTRQMNITGLLEHYKMQDEKNLQLIWSVYGKKSAPIFLNKRN